MTGEDQLQERLILPIDYRNTGTKAIDVGVVAMVLQQFEHMIETFFAPMHRQGQMSRE
jgi:hypothetical protein